jgi:hypothetical protein
MHRDNRDSVSMPILRYSHPPGEFAELLHKRAPIAPQVREAVSVQKGMFQNK